MTPELVQFIENCKTIRAEEEAKKAEKKTFIKCDYDAEPNEAKNAYLVTIYNVYEVVGADGSTRTKHETVDEVIITLEEIKRDYNGDSVELWAAIEEAYDITYKHNCQVLETRKALEEERQEQLKKPAPKVVDKIFLRREYTRKVNGFTLETYVRIYDLYDMVYDDGFASLKSETVDEFTITCEEIDRVYQGNLADMWKDIGRKYNMVIK